MKKAWVLFSRALRLRCPACGGGPLFDGWFKVRQRCPGCGLLLDREQGHFVGAMAFNLIASEMLWLTGLVMVLLITWPDPPWTAIMVGSIVAMVLIPVVFYPYSRTLWYAFDLLFQPVQLQEFRRDDVGREE